MKNNDNGITIVALVITIIVLLIILSITIVSANHLVKDVQKNRLKSVMYLIKARAESEMEDYLFDKANLDLPGNENEIVKLLGKKADTSQVSNVGWNPYDRRIYGGG